MTNENRNVYFTQREREIIDLLFDELTTKEIAKRIFLSPKTIQGHRLSILRKTGARNCVGIIKYGIRNGILEI